MEMRVLATRIGVLSVLALVDAAKAMYNAEATEVLSDPAFAAEGAFGDWADVITKKGSIEDVRILSAEGTDGVTQVSYEVVYADGSNRAGDVTVTQEGGVYRLGLVQ
jgi:hypothetical protein